MTSSSLSAPADWGLYVFDHVLHAEPAHIDLLVRERVEHERVVGIGAVADPDQLREVFIGAILYATHRINRHKYSAAPRMKTFQKGRRSCGPVTAYALLAVARYSACICSTI